jgi:hypothetical protein
MVSCIYIDELARSRRLSQPGRPRTQEDNMTITAKYAGRCSECGGQIRVGQQIEWHRGAGSKHTSCGAGSEAKTSAPRAPRKPAFPAQAPEAGAVLIGGRRSDRSDRRYEVGQCIHCPKVRDAGGGPDGHYYTVLAVTMSPPCEDNQQFNWTEHSWVRPATDAEAASVADVE